MMKVECAWCNADLGWKQGPDGQVSHGICLPCQKKVRPIRRPFSVMVAALGFALLLMLYGIAGECDRQDAVAYEPVRAEIAASAPAWAVTQ